MLTRHPITNIHWHFELLLWPRLWMQESIFFHKTLWLIMMYQQTKLGWQGISSSEDTVERVIFWSYEPSLWPRHSASWCCITIPSLVTNCSTILKIPSRQTFTDSLNLHFDLNAVIQFFHRRLQLMMLYNQSKSGCKQTSSLEYIIKTVIFWLYKPSLWPWRWTQEPICLHDTLACNAA